ncbi:hypothetical protein SARC_14051, partial [Sphaeroforma arctica JP610]
VIYNPDDIITSFGLPLEGFQSTKWQNFGMLLLVWALTKVLAYCALIFKKYGRID